MDGKYWAKVSKRGITEKQKAKLEKPYLNAYLHINIQFTYLYSRKSFKGSRRSSYNKLLLMRT